MSEKMECPGCNSYTSSVLMAVGNGEPCPYCGLSAHTILEVDRLRGARADEQLKREVETLIVANDKLIRENRQLTAHLEDIGSYIDRWRTA